MALGFFPSLHFNRLLYDWTKDDRKSNKGRIDLELFVYHPGYQWIGELILTKLDVKTVAKLRLVSQALRQFVDESRHWWVLHSRLLRQRTKTFPFKTYPHRIRVFYPFYYREQREHVLDRYPTNQQVFRFFENQARLLDLKFFIDCINRHVDELWDHHRKCLLAIFCQREDCIEIFEALVNRSDFDFNTLLFIGRPILQSAVICENVKLVKLLVKSAQRKKINLNFRDKLQRTTLHIACMFRNAEIARCLIEDGVDIDLNAVDHYGFTALHYAASGDKSLWDKSSKIGQVKTVEAIFDNAIEKGIKLDDVDHKGRTPFFRACMANQEKRTREFDEIQAEVVKLFVTHPAPRSQVNFHATAAFGYDHSTTPLLVAIRTAHRSVVMALLEHSEDIDLDLNQLTTSGRTPIEVARMLHLPMIEFLIEGKLLELIFKQGAETPTCESLIWNKTTRESWLHDNICSVRSVTWFWKSFSKPVFLGNYPSLLETQRLF